jgi:hypothetical protein
MDYGADPSISAVSSIPSDCGVSDHAMSFTLETDHNKYDWISGEYRYAGHFNQKPMYQQVCNYTTYCATMYYVECDYWYCNLNADGSNAVGPTLNNLWPSKHRWVIDLMFDEDEQDFNGNYYMYAASATPVADPTKLSGKSIEWRFKGDATDDTVGWPSPLTPTYGNVIITKTAEVSADLGGLYNPKWAIATTAAPVAVSVNACGLKVCAPGSFEETVGDDRYCNICPAGSTSAQGATGIAGCYIADADVSVQTKSAITSHGYPASGTYAVVGEENGFRKYQGPTESSGQYVLFHSCGGGIKNKASATWQYTALGFPLGGGTCGEDATWALDFDGNLLTGHQGDTVIHVDAPAPQALAGYGCYQSDKQKCDWKGNDLQITSAPLTQGNAPRLSAQAGSGGAVTVSWTGGSSCTLQKSAIHGFWEAPIAVSGTSYDTTVPSGQAALFRVACGGDYSSVLPVQGQLAAPTAPSTLIASAPVNEAEGSYIKILVTGADGGFSFSAFEAFTLDGEKVELRAEEASSENDPYGQNWNAAATTDDNEGTCYAAMYGYELKHGSHTR